MPRSETAECVMVQLWLGMYHTRYGRLYALFPHKPSQREMKGHWSEYDPTASDGEGGKEHFSTYGPLKLPAKV